MTWLIFGVQRKILSLGSQAVNANNRAIICLLTSSQAGAKLPAARGGAPNTISAPRSL